MAHAYNLGFLEAEAGTKSSGLPGLYNEILSFLTYHTQGIGVQPQHYKNK